jgi:hypothetical protein
MNYCKNCYKNKEVPLHIKFIDCVKFTSRNKICLNYKKIQELKNKNKLSPKSSQLNEKELLNDKKNKLDHIHSNESDENDENKENNYSLNSNSKIDINNQSENIYLPKQNQFTSLNNQNILTIELSKIPSIQHIPHLQSKIHYIEKYIVRYLIQLDRELQDYNIDIIHMVNELVES